MKRAVFVVNFGIACGFAFACCGVAPNGQPVTFRDQSNIIIWNPETKTEHFVRNAYFDSKAKDFGFIAATPTVPVLSEADAIAFDTLHGLKPAPHGMGCSCSAGAATESAAASVDILQEVEVGKYRATTVRSDDSALMAAYLKQNGYASTPETNEWISFYTGKKWVFTAFKVKNGDGHVAETGVIRMSFKTDEPFNPYYVPSTNSGEGGILKLYFVSDGAYSATVGHDHSWNPEVWNATIPEDKVSSICTNLKLLPTDFPKNSTVTYFEKHDWLDGSKDDLYFQKNSPVKSVFVLGILVLGSGLWWFTKSRKAKIDGSSLG